MGVRSGRSYVVVEIAFSQAVDAGRDLLGDYFRRQVEVGQLQDERGACYVGQGAADVGAVPVYDARAGRGHEDVQRVEIAVAEGFAVRKWGQGIERLLLEFVGQDGGGDSLDRD